MNIDEIIRKCVEVPGISIERGEYSAGLFLNEKDGKGFVTFFPLFPGLTLAYISVNAPLWTAPDLRGEGSDEKGPLLLNYCVTGRCEIILNNGNFVYVTDGDLSIHAASTRGWSSSQSLIRLRRRAYGFWRNSGLTFTALWSGTAGMEAPTSPRLSPTRKNC